jgi:hypothetical protein
VSFCGLRAPLQKEEDNVVKKSATTDGKTYFNITNYEKLHDLDGT